MSTNLSFCAVKVHVLPTIEIKSWIPNNNQTIPDFHFLKEKIYITLIVYVIEVAKYFYINVDKYFRIH